MTEAVTEARSALADAIEHGSDVHPVHLAALLAEHDATGAHLTRFDLASVDEMAEWVESAQEWRIKQRAAEAETARLRTALEELIAVWDVDPIDSYQAAIYRARAALNDGADRGS